jgi:ABC-2 type transport system ATP-binding protein
MIQIENLVKTYGAVRALDGLSLTVEPGVVYGFLGPNGAGKTTTMRILTGLARPDSGHFSITGSGSPHSVGANGGRPKDIRHLIGVMPEEPAFYGWMTAREYLRDFIAPLYGFSPKAAQQRASELLDMVDLKKAAKRRIQGFSRGMRQRLGLAAALVHKPPILLLDEPVSALDPAGRKEVLELIETLRGQTTILLSTHILADVERVCDVVGIIQQGRLILQERREALLARYASPLLEIEVDNNFSSWIETVQKLPFVQNVTVVDHTVRVLVNDVPQAQKALLNSLAESNLLVRRFVIVHPSLEDIFLRLTGEEV